MLGLAVLARDRRSARLDAKFDGLATDVRVGEGLFEQPDSLFERLRARSAGAHPRVGMPHGPADGVRVDPTEPDRRVGLLARQQPLLHQRQGQVIDRLTIMLQRQLLETVEGVSHE